MLREHIPGRLGLAIVLAVTFVATAALADKPPWAGSGKKHYEDEERERSAGGEHGRDRDRTESGKRAHFEERQYVIVRDYYVREHRAGRCPPGLAKKHNGCMPPGQAKKWEIGRPLPRDVARYDLPPALVVEIGAPPPGYRYVRVASDILLIAAGTAIVVDAIRDLGRR